MARYGFWNDYKYTPVGEKQDKAKRSQSRLAKTHGTLQPVATSGRALATSWWGQAWNENLERYSDYSNRLPRGRSYLRGGMVLHLAIEPGKVEALVQGSRPAPYEITINVAALNAAKWAKARAACTGRLDSLQALLSGQFPDALKELFMVQGGGLFPAPSEITFDCTCPDWASMCKHVAAVLYGVGVRLDADPKLFFTLRGVSVDDLVAKALRGSSEALMAKAGQAAGRALATTDLGNVFGIDLDDAPATAAPAAALPKAPKPKAPKPKAPKPKAPKPKTPTKRGAAKAAPSAPPAVAAASPGRRAKPTPTAEPARRSRQAAAALEAKPPQKAAAAAPRGGALTNAENKMRLRREREIAALEVAIRALEADDLDANPQAAPRAASSAAAPTRAPRVGSPRALPARPAPPPASPMLATLLAALRGKRSGLAIPAIAQSTGFTEAQARNAVSRAQMLGLVCSPHRGVYALA